MMGDKKILYIDMDGVLADFDKSKHTALEAKPENAYPQCEYGFFRNLEPIEGSIAAVKLLIHFYDVYFLTAPSIDNPLCYTEKMLWIEEYFGKAAVRKLIISKRKDLNIGDYLIDDSLANGAGEFTGELIRFGIDYATGEKNLHPDWASVLNYFKKVRQREHYEKEERKEN